MAEQKQEISQILIDKIKQHVPAHIVNDYLKLSDKPTARKWDDIFAKNINEVEFFKNLLTDVLSFGMKSVVAFQISDENIANLDLSPLDDAKYTPVDIVNAFGQNNLNHTLFKRIKDERFFSYTFTAKKPANEIYVLDKEDLTDAARNKFWDPHSEIKIKKQILVTAFDSIVFDSKYNVIFVLIDNLRFSFDKSVQDMQADFLNQIKQICPSLKFLELIELFPCVSKIYNNNSEGIVHKLSFECNTGAVRDERLKQGQLDLRNELYHTNGKAAIGGVIRPYKVGVTWHPSKYHELATEVDFEINGSRSNLHNSGGIYSFQINSNITFNELAFALNRVNLYVEFD